MDAQRSFPPREIPLELADTTAYFLKMEVHKNLYWYTTDPHSTINLVAVPVGRVREIQALNRKGQKPDQLLAKNDSFDTTPVSHDLLQNNSLTRFDEPEGKNLHQKHQHKRKNRRFNGKRNQ
jgi:hypothetical protein